MFRDQGTAYRKELGKRIREARGSRTQQNFAEALGIKYQQISAYERSLIMPGADLIADIAEVLNVSLDWLLTGEGEKYRKSNGRAAERIAETPPEYRDEFAQLQKDLQTMSERIAALIAKTRKK
jgi:transcriptional regulator with XRE-family HTH domain